MTKLIALVDVTKANGDVIAKGTVMTKGGNIAAYLRHVSGVQSPTETPVKLDAKRIAAIADTVPESDDNDAREDEIIRLLLEADGQQPAANSGEPDDEDDAGKGEPDDDAEDNEASDEDMPEEKSSAIQKEAATFMARAIGDKSLSEEIAFAVEADRRLKVAPLMMRDRLMTLYGKDLDTAPKPGSKSSDKTLGNLPADYRRVRVPKASGDGTRFINVSYVQTMADLLPEAAKALAVMKAIDAAKNKTEKNEWSNASIPDRAQALKDARAVVTTTRGLFRKALSLHHQFYAVNNLSDVEVYYLRDPKDKTRPKSTRVPIVIKNLKDDDYREYYTVTQFLALDPAECKDAAKLKANNGSVYSTLISSGTRGAGTPKNKTLCPPIANRNQLEAALAQTANFFDKRDNATLLNKWLAVTTGEDNSDDMLESMEQLAAELAPYLTANKDRLAALKTARNEADKAKALQPAA